VLLLVLYFCQDEEQECHLFNNQGLVFASSFKSFGRASACGAFKCACKTKSRWVTRPKKSLHFLLISPDSNLQFILNPKYCLLF